MTDATPTTPHASDLGCTEVREALGAYALGALDADERASVTAHLAGCAECRAALARYETAVDALGGTVPPVPPPASLRERLLAEVGVAATEGQAEAGAAGAPVHLRQKDTRPERRSTSRRAAVALGLVAAALLASIGVAGVLWSQARADRDEARAQRRALAIYLDEVHEVLRNGGIAAPLAPAEGDSGSRTEHGTLIVGPDDGDAMVLVAGIPPDDDARYQVWVARGDERIGLDNLWVTDEGFGWLMLASPEPLASYDMVGITRVAPGTPEDEDLLVAPIPRTAPT